MTSIIISSLLIESKVHQMWCAFRPNDCRLHIWQNMAFYAFRKRPLCSAFEECLHNFPVSTLEFTFSPQHFLEKKRRSSRSSAAVNSRNVLLRLFSLLLKKMIDVETILEAKKKEAFFVDRKNMMWQFFLTFAAVCWSHFVSWPNWLDRCNGASFSQTFSLSSYISMMFIAALQLLIWKVTQTSHLDYP